MPQVHTRYPRKLGEICEKQEPPLLPSEPGHQIRCHIPADILAGLQDIPVDDKRFPSCLPK